MRTERYTTKQVMNALKATKGMISLAAEKLGCEPQTVRSYVQRHPTIAEALREIREQTVDIAELKLFQAIQNGEAWAIAMYLKTIGRDRGYQERMDHYHHQVKEAIRQLAVDRGLPMDEVEDELRRILPGVKV